MAHWQALAKLRLHTETTLCILDGVTVQLGHQLRRFRDELCPQFKTKMLPKEAEAEKRRASSASKLQAVSSKQNGVKKFSLYTFKFHAHGHVVDDIRRFGTTDLYSTEPASGQLAPSSFAKQRNIK